MCGMEISVGFAVAFILDVNWQATAIAFIGAISGTLALAYFRRMADRWEHLYRAFVSTTLGMVVGAAGVRYIHVETVEYQLLLFCISALCIIFVLEALLKVLEVDLKDMIKNRVAKSLGITIHETKDITDKE